MRSAIETAARQNESLSYKYLRNGISRASAEGRLTPMISVTTDANYLRMFSASIQLKHACRAVHKASVLVTVQSHGKLLWEGLVETFDLDGHPSAGQCYAWMENCENGQRRPVSVLARRLVSSPASAVKAWLALKPMPIRHYAVENEAARQTVAALMQQVRAVCAAPPPARD